MMIKKIILLGTSLTLALPAVGVAQNTLRLNADEAKGTHIAASADTLYLSYNAGVTPFSVMSNATFTATALEADGHTPATWFRVASSQDDRVLLAQDYTYGMDGRTGILRLAADGFTKDVAVVQRANTSSSKLQGDFRLTVTGQASQAQTGEGIERSYDGNTSTLYHSPYGGGTTFPVTLTYTLTGENRHVDYIIYTPRLDGQTNGNFGAFTVEYTTADAPGAWEKLGD